MKAKDYHARYLANKTEDELIDIATAMVLETKEIALKRSIKSDSAMAAILREQDDKWKAFVRLNPGINPSFFKIVLHKLIPVAVHLLP